MHRVVFHACEHDARRTSSCVIAVSRDGDARDGNGAVFQMAPQRFPADIELITGIVGAAGGLGGFFLPSALGALKDISGSYGTGLLCFAGLMIGSLLLLLEFGVQWKSNWPMDALNRTMVFSYRNS